MGGVGHDGPKERVGQDEIDDDGVEDLDLALGDDVQQGDEPEGVLRRRFVMSASQGEPGEVSEGVPPREEGLKYGAQEHFLNTCTSRLPVMAARIVKHFMKASPNY